MAAPTNLPALPPVLKQLQHYLKTAIEYDKRDPIVAYFCRLYAVQRGIKTDSKSPDSKAFLFALMDYLEKTKNELSKQGEEAVTSDIVGQAHVEEVALQLFSWADNQDRASIFNKNVVKSFYTAGLIFDTLSQFGEPSEEVVASTKYAKWKAAYLHKCLKNGETPIPGPVEDDGEEGGAAAPPQPPSNVNLAPEFNPHPIPGAHAPPSTPQDPAASVPSHPAPKKSPNSTPRSTPQNALTDEWVPPENPYGVQLTAMQYQKGMKYCKFAISAMQYEDPTNAIENLNKALRLLTTGRDG